MRKKYLMKYLAIGSGLILVGVICILIGFGINTSIQNDLNQKKELLVVQNIVTELDYYSFMRFVLKNIFINKMLLFLFGIVILGCRLAATPL
jgi:hypothetical protein